MSTESKIPDSDASATITLAIADEPDEDETPDAPPYHSATACELAREELGDAIAALESARARQRQIESLQEPEGAERAAITPMVERASRTEGEAEETIAHVLLMLWGQVADFEEVTGGGGDPWSPCGAHVGERVVWITPGTYSRGDKVNYDAQCAHVTLIDLGTLTEKEREALFADPPCALLSLGKGPVTIIGTLAAPPEPEPEYAPPPAPEPRPRRFSLPLKQFRAFEIASALDVWDAAVEHREQAYHFSEACFDEGFKIGLASAAKGRSSKVEEEATAALALAILIAVGQRPEGFGDMLRSGRMEVGRWDACGVTVNGVLVMVEPGPSNSWSDDGRVSYELKRARISTIRMADVIDLGDSPNPATD